jgi:DNA-binding transcriptional LysR family regulator
MKTTRQKSIDLNLFKVFSAVYSLKNLTHAGDKLAMTQPAVSRALDRLHHLFDERLFYRTEGEMRPTRTAEILAPLILEGLALLETAALTTSDFNPAELAVQFKLGANDYVSAVILPQLVALISRRAPSIFLSTAACTYLDAAHLIEHNVIDCAIISSLPTDEQIAVHPLFREDYVVISARDHVLIRERLTLDAYLACDHVLVSYTGSKDGWVDERLAEMGHQRRVIAAVHMFLAVPQMIINQPYLCTLPRRLARQFAQAYAIRIHELPFESQSHLFHLVWPRRQSKSPISAWLRSQIIETCQDLSPPQSAEACELRRPVHLLPTAALRST